MGPVAKGAGTRLLTSAEIDGFRFFRAINHGPEIRHAVRTIAKRLLAAAPASAPEIALSCLNFDFIWRFLGNFCGCHRILLRPNLVFPWNLLY